MATTQAGPTLTEFAALTVKQLREAGPVDPDRQVSAMARHVGDFLAAYRRAGFEEVASKLAGLVIAAYVTAEVLGIDLDTAWQAEAAQILSRGAV